MESSPGADSTKETAAASGAACTAAQGIAVRANASRNGKRGDMIPPGSFLAPASMLQNPSVKMSSSQSIFATAFPANVVLAGFKELRGHCFRRNLALDRRGEPAILPFPALLARQTIGCSPCD
jgi:hypothetical protein